MLLKICKDPYRLFFPFACLMAFWASASWLSHVFWDLGAYPGLKHAELFVGGFLYFTIFGFLMTAIPRFTQSDFATPKEIYGSILLIISVLLAAVSSIPNLHWLILLFGWALLIPFAVKRFLKRKSNPPETFIFVGAGVFCGFFGTALTVVNNFYGWNLLGTTGLGKLLFYDAMTLALILGIGSKLIPGILGFTEIEPPKSNETKLNFFKDTPLVLKVAVPIFILSFYLESKTDYLFAFVLRAAIVLYMAVNYWKLQKTQNDPKWHSRFLKVSALFVVVGNLMLPFFLSNIIAIKHLIYVGGFSLMTFLIASRVVLAHSNEGLGLERKFLPYASLTGILVLGALTRATAHLIPNSYMNHLAYAGACYFLATGIWALIFIPKILGFSRKES